MSQMPPRKFGTVLSPTITNSPRRRSHNSPKGSLRRQLSSGSRGFPETLFKTRSPPPASTTRFVAIDGDRVTLSHPPSPSKLGLNLLSQESHTETGEALVKVSSLVNPDDATRKWVHVGDVVEKVNGKVVKDYHSCVESINRCEGRRVVTYRRGVETPADHNEVRSLIAW